MSDGTPVAYEHLIAGGIVSASDLNDNFEKLNTYLGSPGLENAYIDNSVHNVAFTWHMDNLPIGKQIISFRVPSLFSGTGLTLVEAQLWVDDVNTTGVVNVNIHFALPATALNQIMPADLSVTADQTPDNGTNFTANSQSGTFATAANIYIEYDVTTATCDGVTITLFAKAANRS